MHATFTFFVVSVNGVLGHEANFVMKVLVERHLNPNHTLPFCHSLKSYKIVMSPKLGMQRLLDQQLTFDAGGI